MAIRNIIQDTDPQIRKVSKVVSNFDESLWQLLDDMRETMHYRDGVGLAAVQVGVLKRVFIVEINDMYLELVNPQIIKEEGEQQCEEGCLSIEKYLGVVKRPAKITVTAQDRAGNPFMIMGTGYLAIALSHEYDHLEGVLFTDKAVEVYEKVEK